MKRLTTFDKIVIGLTLFVILWGTMFAGVLIMGGMIIALGFVFSVAVLMHKFKFIRRLVLKYAKWFDMLAFIIAFALAGGVLGVISAVFIGMFTSAFLSLYVRFQGTKNEVTS